MAGRRLLALLVAAAACATAPVPGGGGPAVAIVGVTVVHPEREGDAAAAPDSTVVIAGNRIQWVGPSSAARVPGSARVVDGRGRWVVPGLVDAHVHFFQSGNLYTRPDVADLTSWMPYAREDARNRSRLPATFRVWLASGVTGVVDVGGPFWNFEVRDAAARTAAAPRVAVAGPLLSMIDRPQLDLGDPPIVRVGSPEAARALARRELARGPEWVKVWFIHRPGDDLAAQEAVVRAAAEEAHAAGARLAVHATELAVAKAALRAGADYLVHSVEDAPVDEEFLSLARRNRALYCPTLFVRAGYALALSGTWKPTREEQRLADPQIVGAMGDLALIPREKIPERVARRMAEPAPPGPPELLLRNLRAVRDAGVAVVLGTDAGNIGTLHGPSVFRELALMESAGLTPLEALRAATVHGARALGREAELGTIAPGKLADLVILDADPVAAVANLSRVHRVVKDGQVFDPDELLRSLR